MKIPLTNEHTFSGFLNVVLRTLYLCMRIFYLLGYIFEFKILISLSVILRWNIFFNMVCQFSCNASEHLKFSMTKIYFSLLIFKMYKCLIKVSMSSDHMLCNMSIFHDFLVLFRYPLVLSYLFLYFLVF